MDITDYIPNVFGRTAPTTYDSLQTMGLITPQQVEQQQKTANIQGLLGAGLALAQGMSRTGPRRSAAENILGALAGGFGASGGAYQQGIQNIVQQQQLQSAMLGQQDALLKRQQTQAQQGAIEALLKSPQIANDPLKVAYIRSNPNEALKLYSELIPLQEAGASLSQPQAVQPQVAPQVTPQVTPQVAMTGEEKQLAPVVSAAKPSSYNQRIAEKENLENIVRTYGDPKFAGNERASKTVDQALKRLEVINKEITKASVSDLSGDLGSFRASAPEQFRPAIDNLMNIAATGEITPDQYAQRVASLQKDINDYRQKEIDYERAQKDYTKEAYRVGAKIAPGVDPKDYTPEILAKIDAAMFGKDKELRKAGRNLTTVKVGDKVLAGERAKSQSKAEESAINAQNIASDITAIVDILKPYSGGALQDFAGSIGAYLPGTELEQLATARQVAESIRARIAPTIRVEGSGSTSDFEAKSYLSAIPSLFNTAAGRDLMAVYAQRLADRAVAAADIRARLVEENRYSIKNFQEELKKQGLDRVFSAEDIAILRGKTPTDSSLPADVRKKYGL